MSCEAARRIGSVSHKAGKPRGVGAGLIGSTGTWERAEQTCGSTCVPLHHADFDTRAHGSTEQNL